MAIANLSERAEKHRVGFGLSAIQRAHGTTRDKALQLFQAAKTGSSGVAPGSQDAAEVKEDYQAAAEAIGLDATKVAAVLSLVFD